VLDVPKFAPVATIQSIGTTDVKSQAAERKVKIIVSVRQSRAKWRGAHHCGGIRSQQWFCQELDRYSIIICLT
jgi:hypothetical protein